MLRAEQWFGLWQSALVHYHFQQGNPIEEAKKRADKYVQIMKDRAIEFALEPEPGDNEEGAK